MGRCISLSGRGISTCICELFIVHLYHFKCFSFIRKWSWILCVRRKWNLKLHCAILYSDFSIGAHERRCPLLLPIHRNNVQVGRRGVNKKLDDLQKLGPVCRETILILCFFLNEMCFHVVNAPSSASHLLIGWHRIYQQVRSFCAFPTFRTEWVAPNGLHQLRHSIHRTAHKASTFIKNVKKTLQWHGVLPVCLLQATARIYRRFGLKEVIAVVKVWFDCTIELSFSFQAVFHPSSAMPYRM